jgi:hypothetical protein
VLQDESTTQSALSFSWATSAPLKFAHLRIDRGIDPWQSPTQFLMCKALGLRMDG